MKSTGGGRLCHPPRQWLFKTRALLQNMLSLLTTLPVAIIAYFLPGATQEALPFILALYVASFIYIAVANLAPVLHRQTGIIATLRQPGLIMAGIGTIALFKLVH